MSVSLGKGLQGARLPQAIDPAHFDHQFRADHAAWRFAIAEVCRGHELPCESISPYDHGSNLVALVEERWVVKIFPPFHLHQWESEHRALAQLRGAALPLRVPRLVAQGMRDDGWPYVIIDKLAGTSLEACWQEFSAPEKARALERIGATMAAVHRIPLGELATLPPEWGAFLREQKTLCRRRHTELGVPTWFVEGIDGLVSSWAPADDAKDRVLLTGEYTPFNLLAERDEGGWQVTGMIDFGDAMVGPRDYDFLGPSMFSCNADRSLVSALFRGYFGAEHPIDSPTRMRLMALAVLHRYANFDVQLRVHNWRERAMSFEGLAQLVWP